LGELAATPNVRRADIPGVAAYGDGVRRQAKLSGCFEGFHEVCLNIAWQGVDGALLHHPVRHDIGKIDAT
jgi:hypothetical protein